MANNTTHSKILPIYGALFNVAFEFRKSDGTTLAPTALDTEISKDFGTFADATNEVTLIKEVGGSDDSAYGYITLTAAEMTADDVTLQVKSTNCVTIGVNIRPERLVAVRTGTAQAGANTTITLDANASAVDDFYNGFWLRTDDHTGAGQARQILDYVGSTKVATVRQWETNPDNTTDFTVGFVQSQAVNAFTLDALISTRAATGADGDTLKTLSDQLDGPVSANLTQIDGKDTDGSPNVSDRPKLYLNLLDLTSDDSDGALIISNTTGPMEGPAVDINGQVDITGDAGGTGILIVNNTTVSGLGGYGAVFAGITAPVYPAWAETGADSDTLETLSDQLDAIVGGDADSLETLSDQLDAIAVGVGGTGSSTLVYTVTDANTGLPIADCKVWATTDLPGNNIVAGAYTSLLGVVTLYLDPGTYYIWRRKSTHTFTNPDSEVVT